MKRSASILAMASIILAGMFACAKPCPVPPPPPPCDSCCPECLECPDGYETIKTDLAWICKEKEPPPPPSNPDDYYTLERVGVKGETCNDSTGMLKQLCQSQCPWPCWRDPGYVHRFCPWGCADGYDPMFDLTVDEMFEFSEEGLVLDKENMDWQNKLQVVNRRCEPSHPEHHPDFCGRSDVRKNDYPNGNKPAYKLFTERFVNQKNHAMSMRVIAQQDPVRETCAYDSIAGWCSCRNYNVNIFAAMEALLKENK